MSTSRNQRSRLAAVWAREASEDSSVSSVEELQAFARGLARHTPEVQIKVDSLDMVRTMTLIDPELTVDRLVLGVTGWERPLRGWHGRLGRINSLRSYSVSYPAESTGPAQVEIEVAEPAALADLARAAYPLLGVDRGQHGYGYVELASVGAPSSALALLPCRTAPGIPALPSHHLDGIGLSRADLGLVGNSRVLDELTKIAEVPELTMVRHPLLVDPSGHLALSDRHELPLVDLNIHNPIGRLHTFDEPSGTFALSCRDDELTFTPVATGTGAPAAWSRSASVALSGREVSRLRDIEAIDLSTLSAGAADELLVYRRLAELAATGVVLHSLPASFSLADQVLGSQLADLLRMPYRSCTGLVRELRTVPQRREAMQRFGGFFELAGHAQAIGHRLLPRVSVVLSSMRPTRVTKVLSALAAQRYPHVEIAVALHGVNEPADPEFHEAVRLAKAMVFKYEASIPFGSVLAETARRTTGDLLVKIDDDDVYGPRVIEDLVLAYLYSNADVVGKTTEYLYFEDIDHTAHRKFQTERYHTQVAGGAMLLSRAALTEIGGWRPTPNSTDRSILIRVGNSGGVAYRTHSLGYVYVRHSDGHTWKQMDSMLLRHAPEQWPRFMNVIVEG